MTLFLELNEVIQVLEAQLPANPRSPENARQEKRLQRELARYFRSLEDAFPFDRLDAIYYKFVKESLGGEAGEILDSLLAAFDSQLQGNIAGQLATTYYSGSAQMVSYGKTKMGVPITFEGPPISEAIEWAEKHSATLVKGMNKETKKRLAHTISQGIENKRGIPGLSRDIRMSFDDMGRYRSQLIARTETANALSTASLERMGDMGIDGKEWVTVGDADVSPECLGNESEGVIPVKNTFSGGVLAPPQHPNAVFEGYGFFPYGSLSQMLCSGYNGSSIALEVERNDDVFKLPSGDATNLRDGSNRDIIEKHSDSSGNLLFRNRSGEAIAIFPQRIQLTIGSNHPILTKRGFVDAQFLNEGDELLYDGRCKLSAGTTKSDFKQVHLIEEIFTAMASVFGYTDIPTPSNYFHGDEVFCNSEIKVIRPNRNLLPIRDTSIIEHLSKCNLTGAYTDAKHVASCSSCQLAFNRVFAPTPSNVSSSRHIEPSFGREISPAFFHSYRLIAIHKTSFIGMAFDASTSTELYNIGGIIVKNCRCAIAPAMLPEPEKPPVEPVPKVEPLAPKAEPGASKATQDFIDTKMKVTSKRIGDIEGLGPTRKALAEANLPKSHLETVRSIEINSLKVQKRTHGSMAYCDGNNNIVLGGKVGHENIVHEIGHSFFQRRIMIPNDPKKYDVMNAFSASTRTGKGFVSQYARVDAEEFFAECYAAFAKNPTAFMKLNPTMGKLLKAYWKL